MLPVLRRQLSALDKIGDYLTQVDVHTLMILEAEVQPDAEDVIRAVGLDLIAHHARLVVHGRADEPVGRGALGVLVEDGIENVAVDALKIAAVVAVDDADGYSSIAKLTFFLFAVLFPMISDVSFPDNSVFCTLRFR